ncbi:hypothetical protein [Parachlamydia sp. AcF125]|uniref:hypothetical protein n=1 Tax=Parachlamydia sp. AcF125 TaxID=2795736 RepID=UPI001BC94968|nr:hypothetical protein [Parachlamydia sp. AcF125]MBS4168660.1 hypothetical protein [Parachlamydia sp. AcF125]
MNDYTAISSPIPTRSFPYREMKSPTDEKKKRGVDSPLDEKGGRFRPLSVHFAKPKREEELPLEEKMRTTHIFKTRSARFSNKKEKENANPPLAKSQSSRTLYAMSEKVKAEKDPRLAKIRPRSVYLCGKEKKEEEPLLNKQTKEEELLLLAKGSFREKFRALSARTLGEKIKEAEDPLLEEIRATKEFRRFNELCLREKVKRLDEVKKKEKTLKPTWRTANLDIAMGVSPRKTHKKLAETYGGILLMRARADRNN